MSHRRSHARQAGDGDGHGHSRSQSQSQVRATLRALAFWGAVALPVSYPVLLSGVAGPETVPLLGVVVAANVACLLAGHGHARNG
jgi:hypothetical protein